MLRTISKHYYKPKAERITTTTREPKESPPQPVGGVDTNSVEVYQEFAETNGLTYVTAAAELISERENPGRSQDGGGRSTALCGGLALLALLFTALRA